MAIPTAALALSFALIPDVTLAAKTRLQETLNQAGTSTPRAMPIVSGQARVIDGDTIDIAGERIRLDGIDAPEHGQRCPSKSGGTWRCGRSAMRHLKQLVGTEQASCRGLERGRYGRLIAQCSAGGVNLNDAMVRAGLAWAFIKYSGTYRGAERAAKAARSGIWAAEAIAQPAWEYRRSRWAYAQTNAPEGCPIKGNVSRSGQRIYHTPWSPWYTRVRINPKTGERWFCSEREAKEAGWRHAASR